MSAMIAYGHSAPGFFVMVLWFVLFILLWGVCKYFLDEEGRFSDSEDLVAIHSDSILYAFTSCAFAVSALMNLFATIMQTTKKKRQCASLVLFIEVIACTTYVSLFLKIFPDLKAFDGKPFDWIHVFQWSFTTPTMLVILCGLGTSMDDRFVADWPLTLKSVAFVELTLLAGWFSMLFTGWCRFILLMVAFSMFILLCRVISRIMKMCMENAGTGTEVQTLAVLKWITYCLWSSFGVCQTLEYLEILSRKDHRIVRTILDCLVKTVYSVFLLSSNIHVLDVVAEIRLVQLAEAAQLKDKSSKRNQLMNRALQLACIETEAKDRLSRRFVCNMSHELRTPLNSIIAFNTLLMESVTNEEHVEIIQNSLTSAKELLRIITHLLDHVRTEDPAEAAVEGRSLSTEIYLNDVIDDVLDMVAENSFKKGVDVVASYSFSGPFIFGAKRDFRQALLNLCEVSVHAASRHKAADCSCIFVCATTSQEASFVRLDIGSNPAQSLVTDDSCLDAACSLESSTPAAPRRVLLTGQDEAQSWFEWADEGEAWDVLLLYAKSVVETMHGSLALLATPESTGFRITVPVCPAPSGAGPDAAPSGGAHEQRADHPPDVVSTSPVGHQKKQLAPWSPPRAAGAGQLQGRVVVCMAAEPLAQALLRHAACWGLDVLDRTFFAGDGAAGYAAVRREAEQCGDGRPWERRGVWVVGYAWLTAMPDAADVLRVLGPRLVVVGQLGQGYGQAAGSGASC